MIARAKLAVRVGEVLFLATMAGCLFVVIATVVNVVNKVRR